MCAPSAAARLPTSKFPTCVPNDWDVPHPTAQTHIAPVAGVQFGTRGRFAADDVLRLLQVVSAGVQGFVQLPDLSFQLAVLPCWRDKNMG